MKDQYFGDVGDYGKYGLLQFLGERGVSTAVNWYLTRGDGSSDGRFTDYLKNERCRRYSPSLYDTLQKYVLQQQRRNVLVMNEVDLIPGVRYFTEFMPDFKGVPLAERKRLRDGWHGRGLAFCTGADLVFLDPDNGLWPRKPSYSVRANKYVFQEEAADYFGRGQDVVYYCHRGRRTDDQWSEYKSLLRQVLPEAELSGLTFHRGTQRSYIFALHRDSAPGMRRLLADFLASAWGNGDIFTDEPV